MWIKNLSNLSNEKLNIFYPYLWGCWGTMCMGGGVNERGLNKQNHEKIIEIS